MNRAPGEGAGPVNRAPGESAGPVNRAPGEGNGSLNRPPAAAQAGPGGRANRPRLEAPNMGQVNRPLGDGDERRDGE
ncbi:hypothetical protein ACQPZJ_31695 [Actinoplanes sp. CA-054009]